MPPELAELRRWLEKADHDLRTAEAALALPKPVTDTAAFHCQQAVEKLLKAFLCWTEREFEKIHDLRALALECATVDDEFQSWVDRVAPLTTYAVRFRYPGPHDPTLHEVRSALAMAQAARGFVLGRLPPEAGEGL
jgi:HEPN domain-containing protein